MPPVPRRTPCVSWNRPTRSTAELTLLTPWSRPSPALTAVHEKRRVLEAQTSELLEAHSLSKSRCRGTTASVNSLAPQASPAPPAEQHRYAASPGFLECRGGPRPPFDRVVGVLEQIRGSLMSQVVRHGAVLSRRTADGGERGAKGSYPQPCRNSRGRGTLSYGGDHRRSGRGSATVRARACRPAPCAPPPRTAGAAGCTGPTGATGLTGLLDLPNLLHLLDPPTDKTHWIYRTCWTCQPCWIYGMCWMCWNC